MTAPAIVLTDAGKRFRKYVDAPTILSRARRRAGARSHVEQLWAIRHVDLEVSAGECLGVVGRNGSGKSTLLSMLAGVTAPTEGSVTTRGRVAPLISVGVGFHPELTGRENVHVNGTVLGLSRGEVERRFDEIVHFAGIGSFLDTPVKFYSSGMFVRLGFAVAVTASPDVLLVDEVLAVGDLSFQIRCYERMQQISAAGTTIVVVSHNLNAVRRLCSRVAVLDGGRVRFVGGVEDALSAYHGLAEEAREPETLTAADAGAGGRVGAVTVTDLQLRGPGGERTAHVSTGEDVTVVASLTARAPVASLVVGMTVTSESGVAVYSDSTLLAALAGPPRPVAAGETVQVAVRMRSRLVTGSFALTLSVADGEAPVGSSAPLLFYSANAGLAHGLVDLAATFEL